ncbi:hypothetical protein MRB53_010449 [Persea americana]|uniref:Uncharacterized protein n=1 Tax=Persea americana TaxID=3435 RepID=A0ACC2LSU9_PERAE|nr:hypothetical protein MRB53_010449 [Persea americana]
MNLEKEAKGCFINALGHARGAKGVRISKSEMVVEKELHSNTEEVGRKRAYLSQASGAIKITVRFLVADNRREKKVPCLRLVSFVAIEKKNRRQRVPCVFCKHLPMQFVDVHHQILRHQNRRRSFTCTRTAPSLQKRKVAPGYKTGEEVYRIAADPVLSLLLHRSLRRLHPSPDEGGRRCCHSSVEVLGSSDFGINTINVCFTCYRSLAFVKKFIIAEVTSLPNICQHQDFPLPRKLEAWIGAI